MSSRIRMSVLTLLLLAAFAAAACKIGPTESSASRQPSAIGDVSARPIVMGQAMVLASRIFDNPIDLSVYVPPGYDENSERYPVLIAFMAKFQAVAGIVDGLAGNTVPPMIVVSVALNPVSFSLYADDDEPRTGQADRIVAFLREELIPFLESRYRTHPLRIGFGSSSSALFCLYALFTAPDIFQAALAAGPMFAEFDYGRVSAMMERAIDSRPARDQYFFVTRGDQPELDRDLAAFQEMIKKKYAEGKTWLHGDYNPEPGETHASLGYKTLHDGLRNLFAGWAAVPERIADEGPSGLRAYRKRLNDFWGCDLGLGRAAIWPVRMKLLREKRFDELIALHRSICEDRPDDYLAEVHLAEVFEEAGRSVEAVSAYESALVKARGLLKSNNQSTLDFIQGRLERARKNR
jgi:enterochelin esterase-like enzyme